jgi:hypothetical protein
MADFWPWPMNEMRLYPRMYLSFLVCLNKYEGLKTRQILNHPPKEGGGDYSRYADNNSPTGRMRRTGLLKAFLFQSQTRVFANISTSTKAFTQSVEGIF